MFKGGDELYPQALEVVMNKGYASSGLLQYKLQISYALAAELMQKLEKNGVIGPKDGAKPRKLIGQI